MLRSEFETVTAFVATPVATGIEQFVSINIITGKMESIESLLSVIIQNYINFILFPIFY